MKNKIKISVFKKTLLIIILAIFVFTGFSLNIIAKEQEPLKINGTTIKYKDGTTVYINTEYDNTGGEFRAVWVSALTSDIVGITTKKAYQEQMIDVLEKMEYYNLNAMIFHVRMMNDAFYESKYNSWSSYYNTDPEWDMLPWLIEECHKRGIEFHAWMNPYRVTTNVSQSLAECASHYKATNAASKVKNLLKADSTIILNPGEPEVQEFLVNTCLELAENYNIDAIHFDDYFYAAGIDDSLTEATYNTNHLALDAWRRSNVDSFIEKLSVAIKDLNNRTGRRVQIGIAPTGVWRNGNGVVTYDSDGKAITTGSKTSAYAHYGSPLYADTVKWINEGWIDYILPQTYWAITNSAGPYCDLVSWWDKVVKNTNTNLYAALGLYMSSGGNASWSTNKYEGYQQIMFANTCENVKGCSIYNYTSMVGTESSQAGAMTDVKEKLWNKPIYLPELRIMDPIIPGDIQNLSLTKTSYGTTISFDEVDNAKFYVLYRSTSPVTFSEDEIIDVIGNVGENGKVEYNDKVSENVTYYYGVKAQSNSNTLGNGATISTTSRTNGNPISIGEIEDVFMNDVPVKGETVTLRWTNLSYPFSKKTSYEVVATYYSGDDVISEENLTVVNNGGSRSCNLKIPTSANKLTIMLKAYNENGETIYNIEKDIYDKLKDITNFTIDNDKFYNGADAIFMWNNLNISDVKYTIQYSLDNFVYNDYKVVETDATDFNIIFSDKLCDVLSNRKVYYRVKAESANAIGYSNVFLANQANYLFDISNIKVNGSRNVKEITLNEGDDLTIDWTNDGDSIGYYVYVSYDNDTWIYVNAYNTQSELKHTASKYIQTIPINYTKFVFFVRIEAAYNNAKTESDVIKVYVTMEDLYCDEVITYLLDSVDLFIDDMNIYK